jgi:hypothetical protein
MNRMDSNENGKRIEGALKNALRRGDVPEGFADRLLARVANQSSARPASQRESWLKFFSQPVVRWAAAAALATAMILGVHLNNVRRERAEGEAAKQRLMLALRIAGSKLQLAKSRVSEINAGQTEKREEKE